MAERGSSVAWPLHAAGSSTVDQPRCDRVRFWLKLPGRFLWWPTVLFRNFLVGQASVTQRGSSMAKAGFSFAAAPRVPQ